jgi:hemoglobin-like flavoprotein
MSVLAHDRPRPIDRENADLITESLERVGERCADPTALVYERLFTENPDMRALFVRDTDDAVKGQMLYQVLEVFLDFIGRGRYAANLIACEVINHENLGVPPAVFATFFVTVMETFRGILGEDWTPGYDQAWRVLLAELATLT